MSAVGLAIAPAARALANKITRMAWALMAKGERTRKTRVLAA
jgi:hypothetical protein